MVYAPHPGSHAGRMMTATDAFLDNLARSHLLPGNRLAEVRAAARQESPEHIAGRLVEQSLLTAWQAKKLLAGQTAVFLGKYELLDELGRGGMGAVYKARQMPIGRIVALKIMSDKLVSDAAAIARFHREIRAAAALNDPHVVSAFDAESVRETHFLVMEYVAGDSLADVLKACGRLPAATACEYIRQAALGLAHAHERGMVHRDIKPSNLLLTRDSEERPLIKVLDLGLARFASAADNDELTATGEVMGTPDYMSPEQGRNSRSADIRSDIYSLGCTLFRALTGCVPFAGQNAVEKLMARALGDAPPLEQFLPDAPAGLAGVVARMLARDPAARYQSPLEVAQALEPYAAGNQVIPAAVRSTAGRTRTDHGRPAPSAPLDHSDDLDLNRFLQALAHEAEFDSPADTLTGAPPTMLEQHPEPSRGPGKRGRRSRGDRRARQWALPGAAIVVLLVSGAWGWQWAGRTQLFIDWPAAEREGGALEIDGVPQPVPKQGRFSAIGGTAGKRRLQFTRPGYEPVDAVVELSRGETKSYRPEWTPTPSTVRHEKMEAWRRDAQGWLKNAGGRLPAADDADLAGLRRRFVDLRPEWNSSPERSQLDALWRKLPAPLDFLKPATVGADAPALDPVLAPERPRELVTGFGDSRFKFLRDVGQLIVSPDGSVVAGSVGGHVIYFWDLATGRLKCPPDTRNFFGGHLAFNADGSRAIWDSYDVSVRSIRDLSPICTLPIEADRVGGIVWTLTNRIAIADRKSVEVHVFDAETGKPLADLTGSPEQQPFNVLAASPDGQWLAGVDRAARTRIWNIASGEGFDLPAGVPPPAGVPRPTRVAFSPDSRQLVRGAVGMRVSVFDIEQRRLIDQGNEVPDTTANLVWNPDGIVRAVTQNPTEAGVWNVTEGLRQVAVTTRSQPHVRAMLTPDGQKLITSGRGGEVQVWDARTGEELLLMPPAITAAAIDPLGEWIALGTNAQTVEIRALPGGELRETLPVARRPLAICVSPGRRFLAVASQAEQHINGTITIFEDFHERMVITDLPQSCALAFTPDGSLLTAADWQNAWAWSTDNWLPKFKQPLPFPPGGYSWAQVAVSSDGRNLIVSGWDDSRGGIVGYSLPEGRRTFVNPFGPVHALTATNNPRGVVLHAGNRTQWIDVERGKAQWSMQVYPEIDVYGTALATSPSGDMFLSASSDGRMTVLETELMRLGRSLFLGSDHLSARQLHFTPDGRHVVTCNSNGTVYLLRLESWPPVEETSP